MIDEFTKETSISSFMEFRYAKLYFAKMDTLKEWYVEYYFLKPGTKDQYKRFKERFNMNRIQNAEKRYAYGKKAEDFMNKKLEQGYNPFEEVGVEKVYDKEAMQEAIKTYFNKKYK